MVEKTPRPELFEEEHNFIENMKALRENRGWSQTELARIMARKGWDNYTQMTISRTEKHERPLRLSEAVAICEVLGTDMRHMTAPPSQLTVVQHLELSLKSLENSKDRLGALLARIQRQQAELHGYIRMFRNATDSELETGRLGWDIEKLVHQAEEVMKWSPAIQQALEVVGNGEHPEEA